MNPEFRTTSALLRSVFATCAVLATSLVAGAIYGLVVHYSADTQVAAAQPVLVAQH